MEEVRVKEEIRSVMRGWEGVGLVDIWSEKVGGDEGIEKMIGVKGKERGEEDGEIVGMVRIVREG